MDNLNNQFALPNMNELPESNINMETNGRPITGSSDNASESGSWTIVQPKKPMKAKKDIAETTTAQKSGSKQVKNKKRKNNKNAKKANNGSNKATEFNAAAYPTLVPLSCIDTEPNANAAPATAQKAPKAPKAPNVRTRKETPAEYRARHARLAATKEAREEAHKAYLLREERLKARAAYLDRENKRAERRAAHEAYLEREAKRKKREAKREEYLEKKAQREERDPRFHNGGGFGYVLKKGQTTRLGLQA